MYERFVKRAILNKSLMIICVIIYGKMLGKDAYFELCSDDYKCNNYYLSWSNIGNRGLY